MSKRNEVIEAMALAVVAELGRQDGYDDPWEMENGKIRYLDQGEVDMLLVGSAALDAALLLLEKPDEDMIIAAINHRDEMDYPGVFVAMLNTLKAPA